uniref:Uncharacterized protein n=1 Tax=Anguilla anguilla TaxID=7936 RepID=A0A0E9VTP2_ANGAN
MLFQWHVAVLPRQGDVSFTGDSAERTAPL